MLKCFSSWGSLTSRSQRRNCSEQQGSKYNPMAKNVMRFVLSAGGAGGGGVGFSKTLTGRLRPGFQPLTLLYTYTIVDTEKVPLLYTLYWKNGIPVTYLLLEICIPFSCCKYTIFTSAPVSNPLPFYIPIPLLTQKRYPFCIPYIEKWYPCHTPTLRTLHPFQLL